jgi:predicted nucleic acid-binding protein
MTTYAIDTNIISYLLKGNTQIAERINAEIADGNRIVLPPVVYYEIQRWLLHINAPMKLRAFEELCADVEMEGMEAEMFVVAAKEHARLKKAGYTLDDADVFIAAYCMANRYTLITNNTKHFKHFEGLALSNWIG